ncbi:hypothetical protein ES703_85393 [subsurface metagenome]
MYTGLVPEGIGAHNSFIRLHGKTGCLAYHPTRFIDLPGINVGIQVEEIAAGLDCHDDFLERSIARPLSNAVDGALHLPAPFSDCLQAICHRQTPQIIMAMHTDHQFTNTRHVLVDILNEPAEFFRNGIAHGIGDIERGSAGLNSHLKYLVKIGGFRPAGIHG